MSVCSEYQNKSPFLFYAQHMCADVLSMEALVQFDNSSPHNNKYVCTFDEKKKKENGLIGINCNICR